MRLAPEQIGVSCFLGVKDQDDKIIPRASAFYVVVPFAHNQAIGRGYLVTAKHNIEKSLGRQLFASINRSSPIEDRLADWLPITVETWFDHPHDDAVDLAVADWRPPPGEQLSYYGVLTHTLIGNSDVAQFDIAEGMTTATVGLFSYHPGHERHTPIVRIGSLAAIPRDKVRTGRGFADALLIEARSVGGLSGSPVFIQEEVYTGFQRHSLLGVVHGHYDWKEELADAAFQPIQTGIAVVTPARKLLEVLARPDCAETRRQFNCVF